MMTRDVRVTSLEFEAETLRSVVDAARLLMDSHGETMDTHETRASIAGVLALIECRLRLMSEVVRGDMDPRALWGRHNSVPSAADPFELAEWTDERRRRHHEAEVQCLDRLSQHRSVSAPGDGADRAREDGAA